MWFKNNKAKKIVAILNAEYPYHIFIRDAVDLFSKDVEKFISDSSDCIDTTDNIKLKKAFITLMESTQKYESRRFDFDARFKEHDFKVMWTSALNNF